jgi:hypothetical protein
MPRSVVYMSWHLIRKSLDKIVPLVDLKAVEACDNHGFHVGIDKFLLSAQ